MSAFNASAAATATQEDIVLLLDRAWEDVQQRTFTKWVNTQLAKKGLAGINSLQGLSDGVVLIQLLEIIGDESLGRYNANPRLRIQRVENTNLALRFIQSRGVPVTNIGGEDISDGNLKLLLGLVWIIVLRFTISGISEEGRTAKEGLLLWCQRKTSGYEGVRVADFTTSWKDGLALCALIHRHRPDLLDYDALDKADRHGNTALAFDIAERHIGIPKLLEVRDVCDMPKPDERSVMTYVAQYFHAFSSLDRVERAGRRVGKFADMMRAVWDLEHDYEKRVVALVDGIHTQSSTWAAATFDGTYVDAKARSAEFSAYKVGPKRTWITEKRELDALLGNIQTKLKTFGMKVYVPPKGRGPVDLEQVWGELAAAEAARRRLINQKLREIKESLARSFADQANHFQDQLNQMSVRLAELDGDLPSQLDTVKQLNRKTIPLEGALRKLEALNTRCHEAGIEENDATVFEIEDLRYDFSQIKLVVAKKVAFVENQIVVRTVTNLTPAQLEDFEASFRHFDHDGSNSLDAEQFQACLASLGYSYADDEFAQVFDRCCNPPGPQRVDFESFIKFMVSITEDRTTPEQLRESFRAVAGDKVYVKQMDLRIAGVDTQTIEYLQTTMPLADDGHDADKLDYEAYIGAVFAHQQ